MDEVISCIERIRVIRGVNYGIITNEQIQDLFVILNLDEKQKESVLAILEKDKITPIPENEVPQKVRDLNIPPSIKVVPQELDEQIKCELRRKRFEKVLDTYRQDLKDKPLLATIYEEEIPVFRKTVTELNDKPSRTANRKIVRACMVISNYRVWEARKNGWVCGTYMSRVREHFEHWVQMVFCEDELAGLVDSFVSAKELTQEQVDMVMVLLHNTPKTLVHHNISSMLDDEEQQSVNLKKQEK